MKRQWKYWTKCSERLTIYVMIGTSRKSRLLGKHTWQLAIYSCSYNRKDRTHLIRTKVWAIPYKLHSSNYLTFRRSNK